MARRWLCLFVALLFVSLVVDVAHATSTMGACDELFEASSSSAATSEVSPLPVSFFYAPGKFLVKKGGVDKVFLFPLVDTSFYFAFTRQSKRLLFFNGKKANECKQVAKVLCYQNELNCADFELSDGKKIHMCFHESVYDPSLWPGVRKLFTNLFDLLKTVPMNNLQGVFRELGSTTKNVNDKADQAILYRGRETAWTDGMSLPSSLPDQNRQALDVAQLISALVKRLPFLIDDEEVKNPDSKTSSREPWVDMERMSSIAGEISSIAGRSVQQYESVKTALAAMEDDAREEAETKLSCLLSPLVEKIERLSTHGTEQQKAKIKLLNLLVKSLYQLLGEEARDRFIAEHREAKVEKVVAPSTVLSFWLTSLVSSSRIFTGGHLVSEQQTMALKFFKKRPQDMCTRFAADKKKVVTCGTTCQPFQALAWSVVWAGALDLYAQRVLSRESSSELTLPTCDPRSRAMLRVTVEEEDEEDIVPLPLPVLSAEQKKALLEMDLEVLITNEEEAVEAETERETETEQQAKPLSAKTEKEEEYEEDEEEEAEAQTAQVKTQPADQQKEETLEDEEDELVWTDNPMGYEPFEDEGSSGRIPLLYGEAEMESEPDDGLEESLQTSSSFDSIQSTDETTTTPSLRGSASLELEDEPPLVSDMDRTSSPSSRLSIDPSLEVYKDAPRTRPVSVSQLKRAFETPVQSGIGSRIFNFDLQITPVSSRVRFFQDLLKMDRTE